MGSSRIKLGEDMTKIKEDRWWLQGLGFAAAAVWAGARALGHGRPPLVRLSLGMGALCFLVALAGLIIDRIRVTRRGRRASTVDTAEGKAQEP